MSLLNLKTAKLSKQNQQALPYNPPTNRSVIKASAINLELKSDEDKEVIIEGFARFLNSLIHPIQIICDSQIINPDDWKLKSHDEDYYQYLKNLIESKNIVEKTFYVVINLDDENELNVTTDSVMRQLKSGCRLQVEIIDPYEPNLLPYLKPGFMKVGEWYYDTLIINDWPYSAESGFLQPLYNLEKNITISNFIHPVDNESAISYLQKKIAKLSSTASMKMETDDYSGEHDEQVVSAMVMRDEVVGNEGKFFFSSFYITVKNKSFIELQKDVKHVKNIIKSMMIKSKHSIFRQDDGFRCSLPHGIDYLGAKYNFTTSSLKMFFPFLSSNIMDKDGIMIGKNILSGSLIFLDHFSYFTSSMLVLGKTGSGKSFTVKPQVLKMINQGIEVTVLDTENEFSKLKRSNASPNLHIIKKSTIDEYKQFLKKYLRDINESFETKKNFKPRFLVIDEFWRFMKDDEMAEIIQNIAKAGRKRWLGLCAITQEVEDLLKREEGKSVLSASSIKILLRQDPHQKDIVYKNFGLTQREWSFIVGAEQGEGILFAGSKQVQFKTLVSDKQYDICNTNPNELIT